MKKFSDIDYDEFVEKTVYVFKENRPKTKLELINLLVENFEGKFSVFKIKQYLKKYEESINHKLDVLGRNTSSEGGQP